MRRARLSLTVLPLVSAFSVGLARGEVDFSREIRPILSENCFFCHGPDEKKREAGLRLDDETAAKADNDGVTAVVPGSPEKSALLDRITTTDPDEVMPPPKLHKTVTPAQVALIRQWIQEGAKWGKHWSYEKVAKPAAPAPGPGENVIDAFLHARLKQEGLAFAKEADAATLVRRVALDLTGLPPTLEELNRFLPALGAASSGVDAAAYSAMVRHYLDKPAYGEHWARLWLDLARYADSAGYPSDPGREIWAYRDWVVKALNKNQPFDQFTIEQIAGDLLPNPTDDQLIATAFHRNTMTQNEGGTDDEEFRNAAVIDRVNTTFAVWMGTTMACAQCHTHKYDPLTLKEYFESYAFFNQSADADRKDETPLHSLYTPEMLRQKQALETELAALEKKFANPEPAWLAGLAAWDATFVRDLGWKTPAPVKVATRTGQQAVVEKDSIISLPQKTEQDSYTVDLPLELEKLSALRVETFPAPGRGNHVITQVKAEVIPPADAAAPLARYVRIELPGKEKILQLAEVQVFSGGENVAPAGKARQSSVYAGAGARLAVDGNTEGEYARGSVAHTSGQETHPWWEVDLGQARPLDKVVVWNRTDGNVGKRLEGFSLVLLDDKRQAVWRKDANEAPAKDKTLAIAGPAAVTFTTAWADYEQPKFTALSVLKPKDKTHQGWAVGGAVNQPHTLTLLAAMPVVVPPGSILRVTLAQDSEYKNHTLGRFRLGVTGDARVQKVTQVPEPVLAALNQPADKRTAEQARALQDYYVKTVAPESGAERARLADVGKELAAFKATTVPVMKDLAAEARRKTFVQLRGNWQALGDEVKEGTPAAFHPLPADAPRNRLTLARWLVSRDNPLTARVTVNRYWESIFGTGIVRTSEEFGSQGELPFHPELLDWLAAEFMDGGWDVKALLHLMLTSRAYRQDSRSTPEMNERDPDNRLLARGPRFRPTGELLRDQALAVSGLLSPKMYGKPVRPLRPSLGLNTAFGGNNDWITSEGEDKHRRSLYTEVKRNSPYPSFTTFDAGNREVCTIRRGRTNTPLQAFVTLNDPVFVETNQALARRLVAEGGADTASRLRHAFLLCLSREPTQRETAALTNLHDDSLASYRQNADSALKMATEPLGPAPAGADVPELAAWTVVANVITNLDEFLMRK